MEAFTLRLPHFRIKAKIALFFGHLDTYNSFQRVFLQPPGKQSRSGPEQIILKQSSGALWVCLEICGYNLKTNDKENRNFTGHLVSYISLHLSASSLRVVVNTSNSLMMYVFNTE